MSKKYFAGITTKEAANVRLRELMKLHHPDAAPLADAKERKRRTRIAAAINVEYDELLKELEQPKPEPPTPKPKRKKPVSKPEVKKKAKDPFFTETEVSTIADAATGAGMNIAREVFAAAGRKFSGKIKDILRKM